VLAPGIIRHMDPHADWDADLIAFTFLAAFDLGPARQDDVTCRSAMKLA
jgi:hypothetical protein